MTTPAYDDGLLFFPEDLSGWLGREVDADRAKVVEQVVWGWLRPVMGADMRPDPVPAEVFSWAIELAAIAHENPSGLSEKQLGPGRQQFSLERRNEILRAASFTGATASARPQGAFPAASPYPDPVRPPCPGYSISGYYPGQYW